MKHLMSKNTFKTLAFKALLTSSLLTASLSASADFDMSALQTQQETVVAMQEKMQQMIAGWLK